MGLFDSIEGMATSAISGELAGGNDQAKVAGGLVQELQQRPGGLSGVLDSLRNNGAGEHADAIQNGDTPQMSPDQVQTGLQGTGLIESVAERAGVSPEVAKTVMATVLPMVLAHFSQNGGQPSQSSLGGLLSSFL
jgi:uncharacterized protein YidB (DUF937 family)